MCVWAACAARNVPAQVGRDHGLPVVVRHLVQEVVADDPGARDEDVEPARRAPPPKATAASTCSREVTSHRTARPPTAAAVSSAAARSKSATTTSAPSAANRAAVAAPMPLAPPGDERRPCPVKRSVDAQREPPDHELGDADRLVAALPLDRRDCRTACSPPGTSSTDATVTRALIREPAGTGAGNRTLFVP